MIKFLDLKKINAPYEPFFQEKLKTVLDNSWYILGKEVETFESSFANYCGTKYSIGVGNGFDALVLIFKGYIELGKLQKGDEIIVPANTYIASILAVLEADLIPVLVEPKLETYNINPNLILEKITSKTKAVLAVHLFVIRSEKRDHLQQYLFDNGIQTMIHYPIPPHKQKAFASWNNLSFPITEKIHSEVLSLPISSVMTDSEVSFVIEKLNSWI